LKEAEAVRMKRLLERLREERGYEPRCSVQTQASRPARYNGDFPIEGEDVFEVLELRLGFCFVGHDEVLGRKVERR